MIDRELLELVVRVTGHSVRTDIIHDKGIVINTGVLWNPLEDDGDALRLAVKLGIQVTPGTETNRFSVTFGNQQILEERGPDPYAATRRAIVRAAAEIGRNMK